MRFLFCRMKRCELYDRISSYVNKDSKTKKEKVISQNAGFF